MKLKQTASLSAAILTASLAMGMPTSVVAQQEKPSISVGHNVVDAVDDVRETASDFVSALISAEEGLGVANWEQQEERLDQIEDDLEQMEVVLDKKAESTDQEWLDWMGGPDYSVTVTQQINNIAGHLDTVSNILAENWQTEGIQVLVASDILEQLRDLGETTGDLLNAMEDGGDAFGWETDPKQFEQARKQLAQLAEDIDQPQSMTDAEWSEYLESDQYHVVIYDNVETLADILQGLTKSNKG